jgi:hypothetical protein
MSIHVCKCEHNGRTEYHLRYPGMTKDEAQALADRINGGELVGAEHPVRKDALDRMDALINPANKLLAIPSHSATQLAAFADMATIRAALQDKAGEVPADGWLKLDKPATVGAGTFGVGVSSRLVVEAAQRAYKYKREHESCTKEEMQADEVRRRSVWDMIHGSPTAHPAPVVPDDVAQDAGWFRLIRDGDGWPAVFAAHDAPEPLRGDDLDAAMLAVSKQYATAAKASPDVTVAIDHLYNERRDDMTDRIWPPVKIGTKLRAA